MSVINLPTHRTKTRELANDREAEWLKAVSWPNVISLPSEFDFYFRKFKRVYRIELSHSTKRWVLTLDPGTCGWEQRGDYLRTLCAAIGHRPHDDFAQALNLAMRLYPNEAAFYCPEFLKYQSNSPAFDAWWDGIKERK